MPERFRSFRVGVHLVAPDGGIVEHPAVPRAKPWSQTVTPAFGASAARDVVPHEARLERVVCAELRRIAREKADAEHHGGSSCTTIPDPISAPGANRLITGQEGSGKGTSKWQQSTPRKRTGCRNDRRNCRCDSALRARTLHGRWNENRFRAKERFDDHLQQWSCNDHDDHTDPPSGFPDRLEHLPRDG